MLCVIVLKKKNVSVSMTTYYEASLQFLAAKPKGTGKRLLIHRYILYLIMSALQ